MSADTNQDTQVNEFDSWIQGLGVSGDTFNVTASDSVEAGDSPAEVAGESAEVAERQGADAARQPTPKGKQPAVAPQQPSDNLNRPFEISASVGARGKNNPDDVQAVQAALNRRANAGLDVDGKCGNKTITAIIAFQKTLGGFTPDGLILPGHATAKALAGGGGGKPQPQPDATSKVNVTVADRSNDKPIKGATIKIGKESEETDDNGKAVVSLPPGIFPFTISADGFEDTSGNHEVPAQGDSEIIEVLTPKAAPPKPDRQSTTVFPEKVKALKSALAELDGKVDEALAAEADLRAAAARRKIKLDDTDDIVARLTKAAASIDDGALKTLRTARELVSTASDALQNTAIEVEGARANVAAFAKLQDLKTVDGDDGSDAIKEAVDAFDFWVNGVKAMIDLLDPDPVLAAISAIAEFANSDLVKDKLTDLLKKVTEQQKRIQEALNKAVTALQQLALDEIATETQRARQLGDLLAREVQHYHTAVSTFLKDLATLPGKAGAKPSPDMKAVTDTYTDVVTVNSRMKNLGKQIVGKSILADKSLRAAMLPLGTFDPDQSKVLSDFQARQVSGASAALVFNSSRGKVVFFVPAGVAESDIEDMSAALKHLDDLTPAVKRMSDLSSAWESAMSSGLSL